MIVIRKKRKENGTRDEDFWSNPHSKADIFSRSNEVFLDKIKQRDIIMLAMAKMMMKQYIMFIINYKNNYLKVIVLKQILLSKFILSIIPMLLYP